jgi:hypothetical protein
MNDPHICIASTGAVIALRPEVTTVGRGRHVDVRLDDQSVAVLHAEIVRRGPYVYVLDMGLSRAGTRVNGRLVARRLLANGDVIAFGSARCRVGGLAADELGEAESPGVAPPELTRRELDVIAALCKPTGSADSFAVPATAREIAADLVVTEAAVKQHLLRLYSKLKISQGPSRRIRLANEVMALGLAPPQRPGEPPGHPLSPGYPLSAVRALGLQPDPVRHPDQAAPHVGQQAAQRRQVDKFQMRIAHRPEGSRLMPRR